jgi:formylglycine-generating enzyme required for sulfatase activity
MLGSEIPQASRFQAIALLRGWSAMSRTLRTLAALSVVLVAVAANVLSGCAAKAPKPAVKQVNLQAPMPRAKQVNPRDGAEMVFVPGGEFTMGSDGGEDNEKPAHKQRVDGFWICTKEVTNGQYRKFLAANPEWTPERLDRKLHDGAYLAHWKQQSPASKDDGYPVVYVSWYAAKAYAEWAGGRLPTEAEWEYAARGGKQFEYGTATGEISPESAHYAPEGTKPVGSYRPNPFGLYDMAGNVWEWCSSPCKEYPYSGTDGREDSTDSGLRVVRGGGWRGSGSFCRAAFRGDFYPEDCFDFFGFRCVVPAGLPAEPARPTPPVTQPASNAGPR